MNIFQTVLHNIVFEKNILVRPMFLEKKGLCLVDSDFSVESNNHTVGDITREITRFVVS